MNLAEKSAEYLIAGIVTLGFTGLSFLIAFFFRQMRRDALRGARAVAELKGYLTSLQAEIRSNTIELTKAATEIRAIWRYIDNAPRRASDVQPVNGGNSGHGK